jgi:NADH:ubiquinone reductase (H+-translocating)
MAAQRVVVIGGGFAGLNLARRLGNDRRFAVTLIDRRNFHLFQPLLYQVATGGLSPANIASPLRTALRSYRNVTVLMADVIGFDVSRNMVLIEQGEAIAYDTLIVATGSRHHYFGHDAWERFAPGLKTIEDATEIRRRILGSFERAELETDPAKRAAALTFVLVGGGPTGVEMAGAIAEIARKTMRGEFRAFDPNTARILLVESAERVLMAYPPELSAKAARSLTDLGVEVWTGATVIDLGEDFVSVKSRAGEDRIATSSVLWTAGVRGSPLGTALAQACGMSVDKAGRVVVGSDCTVPEHSNIFVIGDLAVFTGNDGKPLPGVAQVAIQQGKYVAKLLKARAAGRSLAPFRYHDRGNMATIGRNHAIADLGWMQLSGFMAWLIWLFIHLMYIVSFQNRLLVLLQWAWNYVTRNRSARLITDGVEKRDKM